MRDWLAWIVPLGLLGLGVATALGALGQRLSRRGNLLLTPGWIIPRVMAGLAAWAGWESGSRYLYLDILLTDLDPSGILPQACLEILALALVCLVISKTGPGLRTHSPDSTTAVAASAPRMRGSPANDPFGSIREEPWDAPTAGAAYGGLIAGASAGMASAVLRSLPLPQIETFFLLARTADLLVLGVAGALLSWAWQGLARGHPRGLLGGLIGAWLFRTAFLGMAQAEFPWPILATGLAITGALVAWRYIGNIRVQHQAKKRKKPYDRSNDCENR